MPSVFSLQLAEPARDASSFALGQGKMRRSTRVGQFPPSLRLAELRPNRQTDPGNGLSERLTATQSSFHGMARALSKHPGVYIFRNSEGQPIYVGKAKSLSPRIRSYFYKSHDGDIKLSHLLASASRIETIVTNTEEEALSLENTLIKQMRPRYNVLLRGDKSYPYIKLAVGKHNVEVTVTRRKDADHAIYYGPFFPASLAHQIVRIIWRYFLPSGPAPFVIQCAPGKSVEVSSDKLKAGVDGVSGPRAYNKNGQMVRRLLEGRTSDAISKFSRRMILSSDGRRFEEATRYRHCIGILKLLREHGKAASILGGDIDIIGICHAAPWTALTIFQFRSDEIVSRYDLIGKNPEHCSGNVLLLALLEWLYRSSSSTYLEIVALVSAQRRKVMGQRLLSESGKEVRIRRPTTAPLRAWEKIANKNAQALLEEWVKGPRPRIARIRDKNDAQYRLSSACLDGWQWAGLGGCWKRRNKRATLQSGPWERPPFVAMRRSSYVPTTPSDFVFRRLPRSVPDRDSASPGPGNFAHSRPESADVDMVQRNPPGREARAGDCAYGIWSLGTV